MNPLKTFHWGHKGARDNFSTQIRTLVEAGYRSLGERPVLIGECGVPMDMNRRAAFKTDDWTWQRRMMDAMLTALERANVGFTYVLPSVPNMVVISLSYIFRPIYSLWNYNPDNDDARGDDWNGENFSWFSNSRAILRASGLALPLPQDAKELDLGGRILDAVVRPYAAKTAGVPLKFEYEMATGAFAYSWAVPLSGPSSGSSDEITTDWQQQQQHAGGPNVHTPPLAGHPQLLARETEIFVPAQLAQGRRLIVEGLREGDTYIYDAARQTLFILPGAQTDESVQVNVQKVRVRFDPPVGKELPNDFWGDFAVPVGAVLVALLAFAAYFFV